MNYTLLSLTVVLVTMFLVPVTQGAHAQQDDSDNTVQKALNFNQGIIPKLKNAGEMVGIYIRNMTSSDSNQNAKNMISEMGSDFSNTGNATIPLNKTTML